jgi:hypothetical protein
MLNQFANNGAGDSRRSIYVPDVASAPGDTLWLVRRSGTCEGAETSSR